MPYPKRDHRGKRFGRLVVVSEAETRNGFRYLNCRCDCGGEKVIRHTNLQRGYTRSCGCIHRENLEAQHRAREKSILGQQFGKLTVVSAEPSRRIGNKWHAYWRCQCECGQTTIVQRSALTSHATRSCGCLLSETQEILARTHGGARWPEYKIWANIVQRCGNPNNKMYRHYGARGIRICDAWRQSFATFIADVGRRPASGLQLDRIDNDGHYEPGNVRWVTREQNMKNRPLVSRDELDIVKQQLEAYRQRFGPLPDPDAMQHD